MSVAGDPEGGRSATFGGADGLVPGAGAALQGPGFRFLSWIPTETPLTPGVAIDRIAASLGR